MARMDFFCGGKGGVGKTFTAMVTAGTYLDYGHAVGLIGADVVDKLARYFPGHVRSVGPGPMMKAMAEDRHAHHEHWKQALTFTLDPEEAAAAGKPFSTPPAPNHIVDLGAGVDYNCFQWMEKLQWIKRRQDAGHTLTFWVVCDPDSLSLDAAENIVSSLNKQGASSVVLVTNKYVAARYAPYEARLAALRKQVGLSVTLPMLAPPGWERVDAKLTPLHDVPFFDDARFRKDYGIVSDDAEAIRGEVALWLLNFRSAAAGVLPLEIPAS